MRTFFAWSFPAIATAAVFQRPAPISHASYDLSWDDHDRLVFTQLQSETVRSRSTERSAASSLYTVQLGFDIETMQGASGVTMQFDKTNHVLRLDSGIDKDGVAWGRYVDQIATNGWSELYLDATTNDQVSNDVRMYSAGYIEGLLTCVRLSEFHYNTHKLLMRTEASKHALYNVKKLLRNQMMVLKERAMLVPHIMKEEPEESRSPRGDPTDARERSGAAAKRPPRWVHNARTRLGLSSDSDG